MYFRRIQRFALRSFVGRGAMLMVAAAIAACGASTPSLSGHFSTKAYQHRAIHLAIHYPPGSTSGVMDEQWRLENYQLSRGKPVRLKRGQRYEKEHRLDANQDGAVDTRVKLPRHALLFSHRRTSASIWLQTVILPERFKDKELRILLKRYIRSAATTTDVVVQSTGRSRIKINTEREYKSRLVSQRKAQLDDSEALAAVFELSESTLSSPPEDSWQRTKVVLIRLNERMRVGRRRWPMLAVIGYTALPEDYERHLPEFEALLRRMSRPSHEARLALLNSRGQCRSEQPHPMKLQIDRFGIPTIAYKGGEGQQARKLASCWRKRVQGFRFAGGPMEFEFLTEGLGSGDLVPGYSETPAPAEPTPQPTVEPPKAPTTTPI